MATVKYRAFNSQRKAKVKREI